MNKICTKCKKNKIENLDFYYKNNTCISCIKKQHEYRQSHKKEIKEQSHTYRQLHKEKIEEYRHSHKEKTEEYYHKYYQLNKKKLNEYKNNWKKNKRAIDQSFRLRCNVGCAVYYALTKIGNSKSNTSVWEYVPYTPEKLKLHLESLFEPWMNWGNYGNYKISDKIRKWNIDHIIPQSKLSGNLSLDPNSNFQKCWALYNLRPIESLENIKKGNR